MRFTLIVQPNGKAILTTTERLMPDQMDQLRGIWDVWNTKEENNILIAGETDVVVVKEIELDLERRES